MLTIQRGECVPILKISGSVTILPFIKRHDLAIQRKIGMDKSGDKKTVTREGKESIDSVLTYVLFSVTHSL